MAQINSSFGSGGMSLAMNDLQVAAFILHLKSNNQSTSIRKAASVIGQQACGSVWVMGKDLQVSKLHVMSTSEVIVQCCAACWSYQFLD